MTGPVSTNPEAKRSFLHDHCIETGHYGLSQPLTEE